MALTEEEELELLELEEEEARAKLAQSPATPAPQPEQGGVWSSLKQGVKDIYEPIANMGADFNRQVEEAATTGGTRYEQAKNPLTKGLAIGTTALKTIAAAPASVLNAATDITSRFVNKIPGVSKADEAISGAVASKVAPAAQKIGKVLESQPGWLKDVEEGAMAAPGIIPAGALIGSAAKGAGAIAKGATEVGGKGLRTAGKEILAGEMKIKQHLAQKAYGKTLLEKKKKLIGDIEKYGLDSPTGNFGGMANKAQQMASERLAQSDKIIEEISKGTAAAKGVLAKPAPKVNPYNILSEAKKDLPEAALGKSKQAEGIIDNILKDAEERGWNQNTTVSDLVKVKKKLDPDGNLFKMGPSASDADNLERSIRKSMYMKVLDAIDGIDPRVRAINREAKELLDIKAIADDAAGRALNRKGMSLSDWVLASAGLGGSYVASTPGAALAAGGGILAKKLASQGRGASTLIRTGQGVGKVADVMGADVGKGMRSLKGLLGNERGAVGAGKPKTLSAKDVEEIADNLRENGESSFVRWSRGPKYDKKMAGSRDFVLGKTHGGLSAVEIGNWGDEYLKKRLREYSFLRMKDPELQPHIYKAKKVGVDSDGYSLIDPQTIEHIGTVDIKDIEGSGALPMLGLTAGATGAGLAGAGALSAKAKRDEDEKRKRAALEALAKMKLRSAGRDNK